MRGSGDNGSLTVERRARKEVRVGLRGLKHDTADVWLVVEALTIDEKLKTTGHRDHGQRLIRRYITMA